LKLEAKSDKMMQNWYYTSFILDGTLRKSTYQSCCWGKARCVEKFRECQLTDAGEDALRKDIGKT